MTGGSGPERRREYFVGERTAGLDDPTEASPAEASAEVARPRGRRRAPLDPAESELDHRRKALADFHRRRAKQVRRRPRAAGGPAEARALSVPGQPNWVSIGPFGVLKGQASTQPVVSGRVQDIAVSSNGQRVYVASAVGGVWRSLDTGRTWESMSDGSFPQQAGAQISALAIGAIALVEGPDAVHDRIYIGTGEGHTGVSAIRASDYFGVGMLRSDDGGVTWVGEASNPTLRARSVYAIAVDPSNPDHVIAATTNGVYRRTLVAGVPTWTQEPAPVGAGANVSSVAVGRLGGVTSFYVAVRAVVPPAVAVPAQIYEWNTTSGAWTQLPGVPAGFPANSNRITLAVSTSDPPNVYALSADTGGVFTGIHRLDMADATPRLWHTMTGTPDDIFGSGDSKQGWYDQALAVDPNDANMIYAAGSGVTRGGEFTATAYRMVVSRDGAGYKADKTWVGAGAHADVHALTFRPGSSRELWLGSDGGVYHASDARGSDRIFSSRNVGLATLTLTGLGHHPTEEAYAFCGAQDNGGVRFLGNEIWDHQLPGDGGDTVVDWNSATQPGATRFVNGYIKGTIRRADLDGSRYSDRDVSVPLGTETSLFYPPIVGAPVSGTPGDASMLAFGAESPWVSTNFGGAWNRLAGRPGLVAGGVTVAGGANIRSLAYASPSLLWVGWSDGVVALYNPLLDPTLPAGLPAVTPGLDARSVTSIAIDPTDATGNTIYATFGGPSGSVGRVRRLVAGGAWAPLPGTGPNTLLDVQANVVVVDPANPQTLYVGTDIGVWRSTDAGANWLVFSDNLPDVPVLDLDLVPSSRALRATTYGRGVWEIPLDNPQANVELLIRANPLDQRLPGRPARAGARLVSDHSKTSRLDASPDIVVDAPGRDGRFTLDPARPPNQAELLDLAGADRILASVPEAPATTRTYVTVRSRGVVPADGVRVALLIAPASDNDGPPGQLPVGYEAAATAGTPVDADGWKTVGIHTVDRLRAGRPAIVAFDLTSDVLPVESEASNKPFVLLALVHHVSDPFPAAPPRDPVALVTSERRAAMRRVTASPARGAAAGTTGTPSGSKPVGGTGLVVPVTAALLAHQRLGDIVDQLDRKVNSPRVRPVFASERNVVVHPVERRVLTAARHARDAMRSGPVAPIPRGTPGAGIGSYALLGALGFELPGYTSVLAPGGGWISDALRRGTADPNHSRVAVASMELPLAVGRLAKANATSDIERHASQAFTTGMLASAAAGITVGPQLADLLAVDSNNDWSRHAPSTGAAALERHLRRRFLGGDSATPLASWLPPAKDVPPKLLEWYLQALGEVPGLGLAAGGQRIKGFGAFEADFDQGDALSTVRLRNAYGLVLDDLRTSSWPAIAWWGLLSPILLGPSIAMLVARELPHAKAFFEQGATVTERSVFELLTLSMGIGSVAPFVYSMILWGAVDEHTEAFVNALLMFLARAGLVAGALGTSGDEDQSDLTRWLGLFLPLAGIDVYAVIRSAIAGSRRPGVKTVFALQTIPSLTGAATLGVTGLLKLLGISHDWPFWLAWSLHTAGVLFGVGIPVSIALSNGGGWRSWFMREDRNFPLLSAVAGSAADVLEPTARARVFDTSTLWVDPAFNQPGMGTPDIADFAYPSGMRPLVRLWWTGTGPLEVRHDNNLVTFRAGTALTPVPIPLGTTATALASLLKSSLAGVETEAVGVPEPAGIDATALPWPRSIADPGDDGPIADAVVARARFVPVGDNKQRGVVLRHAPRADLSTASGLVTGSAESYPVIPSASLGDLETSGLGAAADLAALLAAAAAPTIRDVSVADALAPLADPAVKEVVQVFRHWNLDERRLEEWQTLVTGAAPPEGAAPAAPDRMLRPAPGGFAGHQLAGAPLATAMGWLPLWRAWLRVASDIAADSGAALAEPYTPLVRFADGSVRRPTNLELTDGVRYLFDMGAA